MKQQVEPVEPGSRPVTHQGREVWMVVWPRGPGGQPGASDSRVSGTC